MSDDCLFCKIVAGDIPSNEVYSDDEFVAFKDINPQAPTHFVLIPRRHIARISDASVKDTEMLGRMMLRATEIAQEAGLVSARVSRTGDSVTEDGYRLVMNCNVHGGQSVYHIHLHILGGRQLMWPPG